MIELVAEARILVSAEKVLEEGHRPQEIEAQVVLVVEASASLRGHSPGVQIDVGAHALVRNETADAFRFGGLAARGDFEALDLGGVGYRLIRWADLHELS